MKIKNLTENSEDFTGNAWLIDGEEKVLIDVGTGNSWKQIKKLEEVDKVVITHSHYDHTDNLPKVKEKFSAKIYAFKPGNLDVKASKISEGETVDLDGKDFEVFHTAGHKDDSICLYNSEEGILFTGDLIFPEGGFGRTDLEEGDRDQLIKSIREIADLDVEEFYPGHEQKVTEDANHWIKESLKNAEKREPKY